MQKSKFLAINLIFLPIFAVMKRIIVLSIGLLLALIGVAQTDYRQQKLTMDDGLSTNTINAIVRDERGFIWFGTSNGLCRYDGVSAVNYYVSDKEGLSCINALLSADDFSLFVGTDQGIYRFFFATETFQPLSDEDETVRVLSMVSHSGYIWIATEEQGILCYSITDETFERHALPEAMGPIHKISLDRDNQLWVLSSNDSLPLWQLNRSTDRFVPMSASNPYPFVATFVLHAGEGKMWVGSQNHGLLLLHQNGLIEPMTSDEFGHAQHVNAIIEYSPTQLLLGCDDGLWLFDTSQHTHQLYLPQRFVTSIARDHEGGFWIGTHYNGVTYLSPIAHRFDSYSVGSVNELCEDRLGRIWTTRESGGLTCHPKGHPEKVVSSFTDQSRLEGLKVHDLCMDGDDLWIGTVSDGVYILSTLTGHLRHYVSSSSENSLYDNNSCTLLSDRKGTMWVATMEGLCRYHRTTDSFERVVAKKTMPVNLASDALGRIWISTQGDGLWLLYPNEKKGHNFSYDHNDSTSISHNIVNCIFIDGKEQIWIGTQDGLCFFDEAHQCFHRIETNMPRPAISSITEKQGVLWMAGESGILRYDKSKTPQRFTQQDGLNSEQFHPNAVLAATDGRIYFGNSSGFCSFSPQQIKVNEQMVPVFITQLEINNQPVKVGSWHLPQSLTDIEQLDLWYNDDVVSFSFASLSYCSPGKNMYAYKLEGFDKAWNYIGHEHKATYTNLEPGRYTFCVMATNNDGIWSDRVARLQIEVHPPYWWNIYAKILYIIIFVLLVTAFIRFRLYRSERRHRKEIERLKRVKEEEMRVARTEFFTTIAHEIRTPISLIIGPLDALKASMEKGNASQTDLDTLGVVDRNAHRLLDLVNQLLDFRKVEQNKVDMNFAPHNICELMKNVVENFEGVFRSNGRRLVTLCPEQHFTAVVDRESIVKILSNLLSNANKYTKDTITIRCQLLSDQKMFRIEVADNGNGISKDDQLRVFDPFFQTKNRKPGTGIGLSIVKKLVEQHHGTVNVHSELGEGTTFIVELPLFQEYSGEQKIVGHGAASQQPSAKPLSGMQGAEASESSERPRMLIVEDNEDMLTFLLTSFMDQYEVVPARDGSEAVKILRESLIVKDGQRPQTTFDIVISDWMMETMDGPELCSRMRQNTATRGIPFILLTAKTDSQSKVQAMEAGVDVFIEKPFAVKYLEACIQNLLSRKER